MMWIEVRCVVCLYLNPEAIFKARVTLRSIRSIAHSPLVPVNLYKSLAKLQSDQVREPTISHAPAIRLTEHRDQCSLEVCLSLPSVICIKWYRNIFFTVENIDRRCEAWLHQPGLCDQATLNPRSGGCKLKTRHCVAICRDCQNENVSIGQDLG